MARHKGKSRRRVKNWQVRFEEGEDVQGAHSSKSRFAGREVKLGDSSFSTGEAEELEALQQTEGMVTGLFRRGTFVRVEGEDLFCGIAKTFRPPEGFEHTSPLAVGDLATIARTRDDHVSGQVELDRNRMDGMILSRKPRETVLARPQPKSGKRRDEYDDALQEKVIAANMDILLIVLATARPKPNPGLLERFFIIAERGELEPILVINKIDLAPPPQDLLHPAEVREAAVFPCSAETGEGVEALRGALGSRRSVLAGASGVGKSTLINALCPQADAETRSVRSKDQRGRHTTSQSRVYDLPDGGILVDTPGVRELGVGLEPGELPWYFPDIEQVAPQCKFRDCTHTHEPRCAVQQAVEDGTIDPRRYESYLRILATLTDGA